MMPPLSIIQRYFLDHFRVKDHHPPQTLSDAFLLLTTEHLYQSVTPPYCKILGLVDISSHADCGI